MLKKVKMSMSEQEDRMGHGKGCHKLKAKVTRSVPAHFPGRTCQVWGERGGVKEKLGPVEGS